MSTEPTFTFEDYICSFTWRYGSQLMRDIWSLANRFMTQRRVWVAQGKAQAMAGLIADQCIVELKELIDKTDINEVSRIEQELLHDIMAALQHFKNQAGESGNALHQGMTSEDNTSNLDIILLRAALELILERLGAVLTAFCDKIEYYADLRCCGFTHWQVASTTTVGHRLAMYAVDLKLSYERIEDLLYIVRPKGLRGAVGTRATLVSMLEDTEVTPDQFEENFLDELGLPEAPHVTGQTYSRIIDHEIITALSTLSAVLHKFAQDMRLLKSTPMNELTVMFKPGQKGSSAMPHKKNPINEENMCSLTRLPPALSVVSWINAATTGLERTLDESANRRIILPASFLSTDESLMRVLKIVEALEVKGHVIKRNMETIGMFTGIEEAVLYLQKAHGLSRTDAYNLCQRAAHRAWHEFERTGSSLFSMMIVHELEDLEDPDIKPIEGEIKAVLRDGANNVGDAPERARRLVAEIHELLDEHADIS